MKADAVREHYSATADDNGLLTNGCVFTQSWQLLPTLSATAAIEQYSTHVLVAFTVQRA
jgi:hypothetical protein